MPMTIRAIDVPDPFAATPTCDGLSSRCWGTQDGVPGVGGRLGGSRSTGRIASRGSSSAGAT
jgi:hypothetical protein